MEYQTNVSKLQLDISLLCYLYTLFGHTVNFCTEYKRDIYTFRCHPSYGSARPIFDWMIMKFDTGLFPCRLAAVVLHHSAPDHAVQLVVQSTTSRTPVKSTFFQEWNWSAEYITVSPNTIEAPCFVISIRDDNSRVLETFARENGLISSQIQNNICFKIVCDTNFLFFSTMSILWGRLFSV